MTSISYYPSADFNLNFQILNPLRPENYFTTICQNQNLVFVKTSIQCVCFSQFPSRSVGCLVLQWCGNAFEGGDKDDMI